MLTSGKLVTVIAALAAAPVASAQTTTTIFFDNLGDETGITTPGATDFSFKGSNWTGGVVATEVIRPLYASADFAYEIEPGGGQVTFDTPVDSVDFFFVHGFGHSPGTATAFDNSDNPIGTVNSNAATILADPANFVTLDPANPIVRIAFSGAVIDNFSYTTAIETVPTVSEWGIMVMVLLLLTAGTLIVQRRGPAPPSIYPMVGAFFTRRYGAAENSPASWRWDRRRPGGP